MIKKRVVLNLLTPVLIGAGVFLSCDQEDIGVVGSSNGSVSVVIDGTDFKSASIDAILFTIGSDSILEIVTTLNDGSQIDLDISEPTSGASYNYTGIDGSEVSMVYKKASGGITLSESTSSGSLQITSYNEITRKVSGSFSFSTESSELTSGLFSDVGF